LRGRLVKYLCRFSTADRSNLKNIFRKPDLPELKQEPKEKSQIELLNAERSVATKAKPELPKLVNPMIILSFSH